MKQGQRDLDYKKRERVNVRQKKANECVSLKTVASS